ALPPPPAPDEQTFALTEPPPGAKALLGTDRFGRDVLSRVIYGSRISLYVALVSVGTAMLLGGGLGLVAGYAGGGWDNVISRVMDVFFSIPGLLLAVGIAAMRGPGLNSAVIAIAILYTPIFARITPGRGPGGRRKGPGRAAPAPRPQPLAPGGQAHPAQRHLPVRRAGDDRLLPGDPDRGVAQLPRAERPAADPLVGQHAQRGADLP